MAVAGYNRRYANFSVDAGDAAAGSVGSFYVMTAPDGGLRIHGASVSVQRNVGTGGNDYITASLLDGGADGTGTKVLGAYGGASVGMSPLQPYPLDLSNNASEVSAGSHIVFKYAREATAGPSQVSLHLEFSEGGCAVQ